MMRILFLLCGHLALAQMSADRARMFEQGMGIGQKELATIEAGRAVSGVVTTPDRSELLVQGVIWVDAPSERFVEWYRNVGNFVDGKGFMAARRFTQTAALNEFADLNLDPEEIEDLKKCKPGDCDVQLPVRAISEFQTKVDWTSPNAPAQVNLLLRKLAHQALIDYRTDGDRGLSVYQDKKVPVDIGQTFRSVLSRATSLEQHFPDVYRYLTSYPAGRPANTEDFFYWEKVKFGLKTTYRMNHVIIHQPPSRPGAWLIANKQLYASHYFQTALDVWACLPAEQKGFHLVTLKAARVDGFRGVKGSAVRSVVTSRTRTSVASALEKVKQQSEVR